MLSGPRARLGLTLVVVLLVAIPAQASASGGALAPLRAWGAQTGKLTSAAGNRAVEKRLAALRKLVPAAARRLHDASQSARDAELHQSRLALDLSLGRLATRLSGDRAFFLFESYQSELERLARLAGLERAPTGRVMLTLSTQPSVAQTEDELATDSDADGIPDSVETDDDNDGVPDARDATPQGWGIPAAFRARPCVRITEEIPSFRTVAGAAEWLRLAIADRGCAKPRPRKDQQAPRNLHKLGIAITNARVLSDDLTLHVRSKAKGRLHFAVHEGTRALAVTEQLTVAGGARTLTAKLDAVPQSGLHTLRVTAVRGKRRAVGTEPVGVGETPTPVHDEVGKPDSSPVLPTPVADHGKLVDEKVPEGADPENHNYPPAACPDENTDSDGDGIANCVETKGFTFHVYLPPEQAGSINAVTYKPVHVTSNPHSANSDGDAETHDGRTYALTDGQEWANFAAGGISDPSSKDSDGDGLTDVAETYRWGTNPAAVDSDSDSRGPNRDQPPSQALYDGNELAAALPTSPTLADTDGDGESDFTEIVSQHSNPRVAQVPSFDIARAPGVGVTISIPATQGTTTTDLSSTLTSKSTTDTKTDTTSTDVTTENQGLVGLFKGLKGLKPGGKPAGTRSAARFDFGDVTNLASTGFDLFDKANPYIFGSETTKSTSMSVSQENRSQVDQTYQNSVSKNYNVSAEGMITASFVVRNTSQRSIEVRNAGVGVYAPCLPLLNRTTTSCTVGQLAPIGTLQPDSTPPPLGPGESSAPLQFSAKVATPLLQSLLYNPAGLVFRPTGALYNASTGKSYAGEIGETLNRRTAGLTIDYDDGRVQSYTVAAGVDRAWGAPNEAIGERVDTTLESLGLASTCPQTGAADCFQFGDTTTRGRVLVALGDPQSPTAPALFAQPVGDSGSITGAWIVAGRTQTPLGTSATPKAVNLQTTRLAATDGVTLTFAKDQDADQLLDREETALGTSDTNPDSDGDAATTSGYASDYFEARVGWKVSFPKGTLGRQVYSSPISCDLDRDGLPDGPGARCPQPNTLGVSELKQLSDPNNADTNGDGVLDGAQANPLVPKAELVANRTIKGSEMQATGGESQGPNLGWKLTGAEQTIEPIGIGLCSKPEDGPQCAGATGYYRLTWNVNRNSETSALPGGVDPTWAIFTVDSTEAAQRPTASGGTETVAVDDNWLTANVQLGEARPTTTDKQYKLYLHVLKPIGIARIKMRLLRAVGATVNQLSIDTIDRAQYFDAPYVNGQPDRDFKGMAVPGQDMRSLVISTTCKSAPTYETPTAAGPQGIVMADGRELVAPSGLTLPPGGYRFGFSVRTGIPEARSQYFAGVTRGAAPADKQEYCNAAEHTDALSLYQHLPYENRARTVLTAAAIRAAELPSETQGSINVLTQQTEPLSNINLPALAGKPKAGALPRLQHVDIDPTPNTYQTAPTIRWFGFGYNPAINALQSTTNFVYIPPGSSARIDGPDVLLPADGNGHVVSGALPIYGAKMARWYVHADGDLRVSDHDASGALQTQPSGPAFTGYWPSIGCGAPAPGGAAKPCATATATVRVFNESKTNAVRVKQFLLLRRELP